MRTLVTTALLLLCCACTLGIDGEEEVINFQDPNSDFSTDEVLDLDRQPVQFTSRGRIFIEDLAFTGFSINGNRLRFRGGDFSVRFGREDGEDRAYFTETDNATICDLIVDGVELEVSPSEDFVPVESN